MLWKNYLDTIRDHCVVIVSVMIDVGVLWWLGRLNSLEASNLSWSKVTSRKQLHNQTQLQHIVITIIRTSWAVVRTLQAVWRASLWHQLCYPR
jgi:hypothetical protein